ncbi:MAG: Gfo/Idh/MocA family oxidoreductase [Planctomycetes bacterium]|nr:Gfo/Idh/MocA family oxidoreductase [Planctomycetota bacterium]
MKKIPIGIVGLNFGRAMVEQVHSGPAGRFFELAAVCDLNAAKAKETAERLGVRAYSELGELLADPGIPAVGLFTGPAGRAGWIRQAVRAGKDVMTTKPFELDPEAAWEVLGEARRLGRVVHLNSPSPLWPPDLARIREWQERYRLGRPVACRADIWASYREKADGSWYDDPARCPAAPIFRLGIYLINDLVRLLGGAQRVCILESRLFTGRPTADNAQLGIQFQNGVLANVFASFAIGDGDFYRNSLILNHESGTIYRNCGPGRRMKPGWPVELSLVRREGGSRCRVAECEVEGASGEYQWEAFFRAVRGEKLPQEITPEEIVAGVRIIRALMEAERAGGAAEVRP